MIQLKNVWKINASKAWMSIKDSHGQHRYYKKYFSSQKD